MAVPDPLDGATRPLISSAMRRFYAPPEAIRHDQVILSDREAHHAAVVLRLKSGERVVVVDGTGRERVVELIDVAPHQVTGRILETRRGAGPTVELTLIQGVPKGAKMDDIVRMGTELGVARVVPVLTRRTLAVGLGKVERWRRIAVAAAKQSRRPDVPSIDEPAPFDAALENTAGVDLALMLWEGERARTIAQAVREHTPLYRVAVLVGPEGGFEEDEVARATAKGAVPVTLGPLVLRTETAGAAAVAMVLYEVMRRGV